jgi:uncharacterized membrane protein YcaP (DUF421 family)
MPDWLELLGIAGRTVAVYGTILLLLRLIGRRQIGQSTPSDLVTLLLISEAVQNAMLNENSTLTGGLVAAATLLATSYAVDWLCLQSPRLERWIEGRPLVAFDSGRFRDPPLRRENITQRDLIAALRAHGLTSMTDVKMVVIEADGRVSVLKEAPDPAFDPNGRGG